VKHPSHSQSRSRSQTRPRIFVAERVHALNPRGEGGNAILVADGYVVAIATREACLALQPHAEIIDLGALTITPGLIDAHIHLVEWAVARTQVDLSGARSIPEAARMVAARSPINGWIMGRGWNPHHWGGAYPDRAALDAVIPNVAVALQSHDMHALWLNSRALNETGVMQVTADPAGGRILRDQSGAPTGVLLENAAQLITDHLPRYDSSTVIPMIVAAQRELHSYGITGVHAFPNVHLREPDAFAVTGELYERRELRLRVLQHIALDHLDDAIRLGLRSGFGNDWLRVGGVKMFLDGALGSRTAWMRAPYEGTGDRGVQVLPENEFRDAVRGAAGHGIASVVHAIGDAAVTLAFDVLTDDAVRVRALPHRIEHVQCLPADCADKLGQRVVCSVQPAHLMTDWRAADRYWGERAAQTYAFRYMIDNGAMLAFGSDAPVERADPRHGLYAAVARTDLACEPPGGWHPEQRITSREALVAYTTGAAFTAGIPATKAGLAPEALADFVAWQQDPLAVEAADLLALTPGVTVVGGEIVFEA
jgi:predicted amidohydrolase YtcJ